MRSFYVALPIVSLLAPSVLAEAAAFQHGNFARTAVMYAPWKTKGLTVRPWRSDVHFGPVQRDRVLYVTTRADGP